MNKDKYLIVVSVLEGRNFPRRPRHQLIAEVRFDGELLSTDPADHDSTTPNFTQELAWELNKKTLHQHRLQRTAIKVQVYSVNLQNSVREPVGYVMLDLRSAQNKQNLKWLHLLHSKYQRNKPELKIGVYIDEDKGPTPSAFKAKDAPPRPGIGTDSDSTSSSGIDPRLLKPILNEQEGFYQIGPPAQCREMFVISVTVAFAANLPHLLPSTTPLPESSNQFFFYYSLLGNDVTNESFTDLINPVFPAERASVKIRSSVEVLRLFFTHQPGIEIHLCCADQSLGSGDVSLAGLLKKESTEIYMKPVTVEGAFPLNPPARSQNLLSRVPDNMKPVVGVSIVLRKEDLIASAAASPVKEKLPSESSQQEKQSKQPLKDSSNKPAPPPGDVQTTKGSGGKQSGRSPIQIPRGDEDTSYNTDTFEDSCDSKENKDRKTDGKSDKVIKGLPKPDIAVKPNEAAETDKLILSPIHPTQDKADILGTVSATTHGGQSPPAHPQATHPPITRPVSHPQSTHHYCCSIDIRSIKNLDIHHTAFVFVRYTYAFFGSAAPILTHPHIEVTRGREVVLPQSFCSFDFATHIHQLHDTFTRVPLLVEVWDRDRQKSQNSLLGAAHLPLSQVLQMDTSLAVHASGSKGSRQTWSGTVPIISVESGNHKMGELQVVLCLEDWGEIETQPLNQDHDQQVHAPIVPDITSDPAPVQKQPAKDLEYQAAMELELWKQQQEDLFETQLQDKEQKYMKTVAEEWKKREKERELIIQKKVLEYQQLEQQLRKTLSDLDKRERQLTTGEQELNRLRSDLKHEHERKLLETREASRRMKEDCQHQVDLQKKKVSESEDYIHRLKQQVSDAESRHQLLTQEFQKYKEQQNTKPEVRLQSEINLLTLEKVELERKLDTVTKSKVHYKQQWGRALREMARLKQREQNIAKQDLKRQQTELEHMRMRYLAAEENDMIRADRQQLSDIRTELQQLKDTSKNSDSQLNTGSSMHPGEQLPSSITGSQMEYGEDEHITRLIEERDTLLRTGVYSSDDRIIAELDRQIREAIAKRDREQVKNQVIMKSKVDEIKQQRVNFR